MTSNTRFPIHDGKLKAKRAVRMCKLIEFAQIQYSYFTCVFKISYTLYIDYIMVSDLV